MTGFVFEQDDPLARCRGESEKANAALRDYALMGPGRSLRKVVDGYIKQASNSGQTSLPPTLKMTTMGTWSLRFGWQARVKRFDELQAQADLEKWEARRQAQREREWEMAGRLAARAGEMLAHPLTRQRTEGEEGEVTIIEPADWRVADAARLVDTASKVARLAAGMETDKPSVDVNLKGYVGISPDDWPDGNEQQPS